MEPALWGFTIIFAPSTLMADVSAYDCDRANFWNQIEPNTYLGLPNTCTNNGGGFTARTTGPYQNVPASKLGSPGSFVEVSAMGGSGFWTTGTDGAYFNFYVVSARKMP